MPAQPDSPTVAQVVHRAVEVCDPSGEDADLGDFYALFEDSDEPVTGVEAFDDRLAEATRRLDPEGDLPQIGMAAAVSLYLAHRRDEITDDRENVLRLAARAEFDGHPPPAIAGWLAAEGVSV